MGWGSAGQEFHWSYGQLIYRTEVSRYLRTSEPFQNPISHHRTLAALTHVIAVESCILLKTTTRLHWKKPAMILTFNEKFELVCRHWNIQLWKKGNSVRKKEGDLNAKYALLWTNFLRSRGWAWHFRECGDLKLLGEITWFHLEIQLEGICVN